MADCEVEGTIASPLSIPLERAMSPTGERSEEGRNIRTRQNPLGPQERQSRIDRAQDPPSPNKSVLLLMEVESPDWRKVFPDEIVCSGMVIGGLGKMNQRGREVIVNELVDETADPDTVKSLLDIQEDSPSGPASLKTRGVGGGWEKKRSRVEVTSESIELLKPTGLVFSVKLSFNVFELDLLSDRPLWRYQRQCGVQEYQRVCL
ncbi:hypothetical protein TNCV_3969701 [Trichonephila clavipes]|nr:hypothetical protein TNCV_3969701 [Trichonephila clavipes]